MEPKKKKGKNISEGKNLEEVTFEEEREGGFAENDDCAKKLAHLRKDLTACLIEKQEYLEGWQRARADLVNTKRWLEGEQTRVAHAREEALLKKIIPVLDSFNTACADESQWGKVDASWRVGIEQIHKQLLGALESSGVSTFGEAGVSFNPEEHEPVYTEAAERKEDEYKVIKIIAQGYRMNGKVVRPAKVTVAGAFSNK